MFFYVIIEQFIPVISFRLIVFLLFSYIGVSSPCDRSSLAIGARDKRKTEHLIGENVQRQKDGDTRKVINMIFKNTFTTIMNKYYPFKKEM